VPHDFPEAMPHLCLNVPDLVVTGARLVRLGVEVRMDDVLPDRPRFSCTDPFGNTIEVVSLDNV
jgi:hypothetical protein